MKRDRPTLLFVSANEYAPWGASEELWSLAALRLRENNRSLDVAASVQSWPVEAGRLAELAAAGCLVLRRQEPWGRRPIYELPLVEHESSTLEAVAPDFVIISQGDNYEGLGWMEECSRRRVPYVIVSHGAAEHKWPSDELALRLRSAYANAVVAYFVSSANLFLTERQVGGRLTKAAICPIPYRVSYDVEPLPAPTSGPTRLAILARIDIDDKGHDVLFDALRRPVWATRDIAVTVCGRGHHDRAARAMSRDLSFVSFVGFLEDIDEIWRSHHALVLPSRAEGLPAVIVEAALWTRPAVVTAVGGNKELVCDGITGFVAPAPTPALFHMTLNRAWELRSRWPAMGCAARRHIRSLVEPDPIAAFLTSVDAAVSGLPIVEPGTSPN